MRHLGRQPPQTGVRLERDTGRNATVASQDAGSQMEAAREADQAYRAQRHAALSRRMRWHIALLKFLCDDRLLAPYFVSLVAGVTVGSLLVAAGIIRGDRDRELFPWEVQLGVVTIVATLALPIAIAAAADRLRTHLHQAFEREGLTFAEPRPNRKHRP